MTGMGTALQCRSGRRKSHAFHFQVDLRGIQQRIVNQTMMDSVFDASLLLLLVKSAGTSTVIRKSSMVPSFASVNVHAGALRRKLVLLEVHDGVKAGAGPE